jgi:hypothetical protein
MIHQNLLKILALCFCGMNIPCNPSFANTSTATFTQQYLARVPVVNNTLIIPGKSVGAINRSTTFGND